MFGIREHSIFLKCFLCETMQIFQTKPSVESLHFADQSKLLCCFNSHGEHDPRVCGDIVPCDEMKSWVSPSAAFDELSAIVCHGTQISHLLVDFQFSTQKETHFFKMMF